MPRRRRSTDRTASARRLPPDRYFALCSTRPELDLLATFQRVLGSPLYNVEREWYEHARARVDVPPKQISRMHRYEGTLCSRAAWLGRNG